MAEVAPSAGGGRGNRTFLLIIGALGALVVLGLLAVGAIFLLPALFPGGTTNIASVTATPTRISIPSTSTRAALPSPTLVVVPPNTVAPTTGLETATPEPQTATPIPITATPIAITATPVGGSSSSSGSTGQLPNTGLGEDLAMLLGGGLVLLGIIVVARRMRSA